MTAMKAVTGVNMLSCKHVLCLPASLAWLVPGSTGCHLYIASLSSIQALIGVWLGLQNATTRDAVQIWATIPALPWLHTSCTSCTIAPSTISLEHACVRYAGLLLPPCSVRYC